MALPDATIEIQDGSLGQVPASVAGASVKLGMCSDGIPNSFYSAGDINSAVSQLGQGPLVEAMADTLGVAGGPVYAVPLPPTTAGTVGTVNTSLATGAGVLTPSRAPAKTIALKIITGGALATATYAVSLNGGAYSAPILTSASAQLIAGTLTKVTLAAGTYVANDVYTIATTGGVTLVGSGPAASNVTHVSSPLDAYDVRVTIVTTGALGAGVFTYSVDGGNNVSAQILIPSGGAYAIPGTGVVLTFSAATYNSGSIYSFTTVTAAYSNSDVTAALTALLALPTEWGFVHVIGMGADSAAAATLAATVDTQMTAAQTAFRYVFGAVECPTNGSGSSTEADSVVAAAFANFASTRIMVCAGDIAHISSLSGKVIRRNIATVATSRIAAIEPGEDPAWVGRGALKNVKSLYRDEQKTPLLDAARFTTARTHVGLAGYYLTNGNMMAAGGSDFNFVMRRRVMDRGCQVTRAGLLPRLNQSIRVNKTGNIDERDAVTIERQLTEQLKAALVATRNASDCAVVVSRTEAVLTTNTLPVDVRIRPLGYAKFIDVTIGFSNPALQQAA
jgi:hypothetical protein